MSAVVEITPGDLSAWLTDASRAAPLLLDVREPWEFDICRIEGSQPIPMTQLISRWPELDPEAPTVVICHHGVRSYQVAHFLTRSGFAQAVNLRGGVAAWAAEIDPEMPRY